MPVKKYFNKRVCIDNKNDVTQNIVKKTLSF